MESYTLTACNIQDKGSRGIAIYCKTNIRAEETRRNFPFKEAVWVEVDTSLREKLLLHRSPNSSGNNNEEMWFLLGNIKDEEEKCGQIVLIGDFNMPYIDWRNWISRGDGNF